MEKFFYFVALCSVLLYGCEQEKAVKIEKHDGEDLYVCNYFKVGDSTVTLNVSDLVESLEVIKLDSDTIATVGDGGVYSAGNHFLIGSSGDQPVKLFTRAGKFVCPVGGIGRGPGEYQYVCDVQLNEKQKVIALLPLDSKVLFMYNLEGKFAWRLLLAGGYVSKGNFNIQEDGSYTCVSLPLPGVKWIVYCVGRTGELLDSVSAAPFTISEEQFAYNNEIFYDRYHSSIYIQHNNTPLQDTLYHYRPGTNRLIPKFTVNYGDTEVPFHFYREVGDYFLAVTSVLVKTQEGPFNIMPDKEMVINKKTLQANKFKFVNDLMGGYETSHWNCINGYYAENINPSTLKEKLEKALEKGITDESVKKRVTDLVNSIDENDNNYVLFGKLK